MGARKLVSARDGGRRYVGTVTGVSGKTLEVSDMVNTITGAPAGCKRFSRGNVRGVTRDEADIYIRSNFYDLTQNGDMGFYSMFADLMNLWKFENRKGLTVIGVRSGQDVANRANGKEYLCAVLNQATVRYSRSGKFGQAKAKVVRCSKADAFEAKDWMAEVMETDRVRCNGVKCDEYHALKLITI